MPDDVKPPRTLTEDEAYAIVADRVTRETAALTGQVDVLTRENAALQSKLDLSEAAVATATAARETAEKATADLTAATELAREIAARRDERGKKVREAATALKDDFYTDARLDRWAAMDEAAFTTYVAELAELAPAPVTTGAPRETAMRGAAPVATTTTGNAAKLFELSRKGA